MSFTLRLLSFCFFQRSIHPNQIEAINNDLENDRMVRALYDIKATDMGSQSVMFKAEVDIDGREIARSYLEKLDIQVILEVKEDNYLK
jgi:zinc transporter 9